VRRQGCNAGPLGFYGRLQRAGPAQSPPDQDARGHHREVAPAPATSAKYTMPRDTSSGADHFRAVATVMRDVTFPPATKHQNTSIQTERLAAVQGSSRSPLMKKGSMSLYSRIFTVAPSGAFPCAFARNAFSDAPPSAREVVLVDRVILGRHGPVAPLSNLSRRPIVAGILVRSRGLEPPHLLGTCTSSMRVCQFRHDRLSTALEPISSNLLPKASCCAEPEILLTNELLRCGTSR
jgi:hypothetical protein